MSAEASIDNLIQYLAEGRVIRGQWRGKDEQGRDTACLLASIGPNINRPKDCPAEIMPVWLAYLSVPLNDRGSIEAWPAMIQRYGTAARRWHVLDIAAWRRCRAKTMISMLEIALPHDTGCVVAPVIALLQRVAINYEPAPAEWELACKAAEETVARSDREVRAAWVAWSVAEILTATPKSQGEAERAAGMAARWATWAEESATMHVAGCVESAEQMSVEVWDRMTDACLTSIEQEISKSAPRN